MKSSLKHMAAIIKEQTGLSKPCSVPPVTLFDFLLLQSETLRLKRVCLTPQIFFTLLLRRTFCVYVLLETRLRGTAVPMWLTRH